MRKNNNYMKVAGIIFFSVIFFVSAYSFPDKEIEDIMEKYIGISVPGAAVAIVEDGEIIFARGFGFADIEEEKPVIAEETVFEYGSINKLFVWVSAMQLVEKNELDLEVNIVEYLSEDVRSKFKYKEPITFMDLMNHNAGFEDPMFNFANKNMDKLPLLGLTIQEHQSEQIFLPKEVISYSNYGSALAAYIIKTITGEKFYDYERENIFNPSNMINIAGHPLYKYNPNLLENKAKGYLSEKEGDFKEQDWVYVPAYPSGAADGTVIALAKFALALTPENSLDSPLFKTAETFDETFSNSYASDKIKTSIAHGFWEYEGEISSYGHGGNTAGFSSFFSVAPEEKLGLAVLLNSGTETDLIYELQELIFGEIKNVNTKAITDPSSNELVGKYLPTRSSHNNFLELFSYLSAYEISSEEAGEINLSIPGHEANYVQVAPYKYNIYNSSSLIIKYLYPELLFEKDGDSIKRVTSGNSVDLIPANTFRPWIWVNLSVIILATGVLFFMIQPLLLLRYKLKVKGKISKTLIFLNVLGISLAINNILLINQALNYLYYSSMRVLPFIYGNILLLILYLILIISMLIFRKKIKGDTYNNKNILMSSFVLFIFLATLYNWNFMKIF